MQFLGFIMCMADNENAQAILSTKAKQEEWNDAIIDLEIDRLQKQNTQYKSQLELMDAIENLEKAKQRRALVYREGGNLPLNIVICL